MHYCNPVGGSAGVQMYRQTHKHHISLHHKRPSTSVQMLVNTLIIVHLLMYAVAIQKDHDHCGNLKNRYAARNYFCSKYRYQFHRVGGCPGTRANAYSRT